jgi:methane monooxygenase component A beta chain/propane monooxygenase small subunit
VSTPLAPRDFTYIRPRKRRLSEYEAVTCYTQPDPGAFDKQGWYLRTTEGRTAWMADSTRLRHPHWFDFRDPSSQWQRTYVRMQAEQERSIGRATEDAAEQGAFDDLDPTWLHEVVAGHYRVWSYLEYGLFRAFAAAQREALSDTIGTVFCFEGVDRMRHAQDIVLYLMDLEEAIPGFVDQKQKSTWLGDPIYQPSRLVVEQLMAFDDWAELAVAVNLVLDPILSEVGLSQLVRRFGSFHGDQVTPAIVATAERDRRRNRLWTEELVRMTTDAALAEADDNRATIQSWLDTWTPLVVEAALALAPLYDVPPIQVVKHEEALATAVEAQAAIVHALGFSTRGGQA